jgi:hypothetical protein
MTDPALALSRPAARSAGRCRSWARQRQYARSRLRTGRRARRGTREPRLSHDRSHRGRYAATPVSAGRHSQRLSTIPAKRGCQSSTNATETMSPGGQVPSTRNRSSLDRALDWRRAHFTTEQQTVVPGARSLGGRRRAQPDESVSRSGSDPSGTAERGLVGLIAAREGSSARTCSSVSSMSAPLCSRGGPTGVCPPERRRVGTGGRFRIRNGGA